MKRLIFCFLLATLAACTKTETKTETSENPDGTLSTTVIETETTTALDSATVQNTVNKAKEKLNVAAEKIDSAAHRAGQKLRSDSAARK